MAVANLDNPMGTRRFDSSSSHDGDRIPSPPTVPGHITAF
jgi:hypothetical protein